MPDAPALVARRHFPRPEAALLARFAEAVTGNVADAQGGAGVLDFRVKPVTRAQRFAGPALTVLAGPRDNLALWAALEIAKPGDVLVVATGGYTASSVCGDVLVGMARNRGLAAIVTDGTIRDAAGIDAVGIPVFAQGISPRAPLKNGPGEIGQRVALGDVSVDAGDIVVGDGDGVVVVPLAAAGAVADALEAVLRKEAASEREVAEGRTLPSWMDAILRARGIRNLD